MKRRRRTCLRWSGPKATVVDLFRSLPYRRAQRKAAPDGSPFHLDI